MFNAFDQAVDIADLSAIVLPPSCVRQTSAKVPESNHRETCAIAKVMVGEVIGCTVVYSKDEPMAVPDLVTAHAPTAPNRRVKTGFK